MFHSKISFFVKCARSKVYDNFKSSGQECPNKTAIEDDGL